jgi:DNA modification methylase
VTAKNQTLARLDFGPESEVPEQKRRKTTAKRANELDGATWTKYSVSVWSDIRKSPDEFALKHPAMFPVSLARRLLQCFTTSAERIVLDPFAGSGSTLVAAMLERKQGIGFEIVPSFAELCQKRAGELHLPFDGQGFPRPIIHQEDARNLTKVLASQRVDFCLTSPPYWDILSRKRTADYKETRDYGEEKLDLAKIKGYWEFINELGKVFDQIFQVLRPGKYFVLNVMDIRKQNKFYAFHADLAARVKTSGFFFDDVIIWDRKQEYNNLRPLGYPAVFRVNKVHEYLLIFQKPTSPEAKR